MFFTYLRRELRRRIRQSIFIALGLALGIGLVITVTAAATGVKNAQATVLHSLYGVGTDITVTKAPIRWIWRWVRVLRGRPDRDEDPASRWLQDPHRQPDRVRPGQPHRRERRARSAG